MRKRETLWQLPVWLGLLMLVLAGTTRGSDALAFVNGKPISEDDVMELALEARGLEALQQLLLLRLAKQEARRLDVAVTRQDIDREYDEAVERILPPETDETGDPALARENQRRALEIVLGQNCLSRAEFRIGMERNAYLRKIVERDLRITEATLREEFARTYGARVRVRHIQINAREAQRLNEVQAELLAGQDFEAVAREYSQNSETAPRGGLLAPFTFDAPDAQIPAVIREKAFAMVPGDVSNPIRVDRVYQILKLEERLPPSDVRFEDVRAEVEAQVRERVMRDQMARLLDELFEKAKIQIVDRTLRERFEQMLAENAAVPELP